ncbi:MAG: ATP-dependent 6-phosphofructokinase [Peptoniphilaceae bacterium]|nr:ATP-dependent 6-phosphofructokinase [Peptoniphilaceae bacterium]MDY6085699.1 ATP-dependent 6-phosphofructokinase [Peptoniphilaceae bacterium]
MTRRIGLLTSGGDCQSLNATMRGFAKALYRDDPKATIYGFKNGYWGLMYNEYFEMKPSDFSGLLARGGTILGTSRQSFKTISEPDSYGNDKVELMKGTMKRLNLDALVMLGGNGSIKTANLLAENGANVIALPKTIDNDIYGTDMTFGFHSALEVATHAIDCVHTTAASHSRVFIVEIMGHKVGWLALYAGMAGGADVILLPEIPYSLDAVCKSIERRRAEDNTFAIIAVAEGAKSIEEDKMSKKDYKKMVEKRQDPSVAYGLARAIEKEISAEVRVTVPGHMQRGGSPSPYDRVIASRAGAAGAQAVIDGDFGKLIAFRGGKIVRIPLDDTAGKLKEVSIDDPMIVEARAMGISFGDR